MALGLDKQFPVTIVIKINHKNPNHGKFEKNFRMVCVEEKH